MTETIQPQKPVIESITIIHKIDDTPDFSYLETTWEPKPHGKIKIISSMRYTQKEANEHPKLTKKYIQEDTERLNKINNGQIWQIGIYAQAEISVNHGSYKRLDTLQSSGLWGIESDSSNESIKETEKDELADLKRHLQAFNVDVSNFDEIAQKATVKDEY